MKLDASLHQSFGPENIPPPTPCQFQYPLVDPGHQFSIGQGDFPAPVAILQAALCDDYSTPIEFVMQSVSQPVAAPASWKEAVPPPARKREREHTAPAAVGDASAEPSRPSKRSAHFNLKLQPAAAAAAAPAPMQESPAPPLADIPEPFAASAARKPTASWNKTRCSPAVFNPGAQFGVCGFCMKLLMYLEPPHDPGERLTWFGRHRASGKQTNRDCRGTAPAVFEQWRREDWEGVVPRSHPLRPLPPSLEDIKLIEYE